MAAVGLAAALGAGCPGPVPFIGGCGGIAPAESFQGTNDAGVVQFMATPVGGSDRMIIPVTAIADGGVMVEQATFTGSGAAAFRVLSSLPFEIPAGEPANVDVEFVPTASGLMSAALVLGLDDGSEWPILIEGVATDSGAQP
jgi:hypothetical protein